VVFPPGEVTDVPGPFEFGSPRFVRIHHSQIQSDWKQDRLASLPFLFVSSFDFVLNDPTI
jgi:hypothetical protein